QLRGSAAGPCDSSIGLLALTWDTNPAPPSAHYSFVANRCISLQPSRPKRRWAPKERRPHHSVTTPPAQPGRDRCRYRRKRSCSGLCLKTDALKRASNALICGGSAERFTAMHAMVSTVPLGLRLDSPPAFPTGLLFCNSRVHRGPKRQHL